MVCERGLARLLLVLLACMTCVCWVSPPLIDGTSDYIIIESKSGFSNRMRVLSAFLLLKRNVFNVSRIVMAWDPNEECTGQFLDVMRPITNVTFISSRDVIDYESKAKYRFPASYATFNFILQRYGVRHAEKYYGFLFAHIVGQFLVPLPAVWSSVQAFVKANDICVGLALHVRSTDFVKYAKHNNITTTQCDSRARKHSTNGTIFLMTDSKRTRLEYIERFNRDSITTYGEFNSSLTGSLRRTSLSHTITEVLIAAHSSHFCGNYPSSSLYALIVAYKRVLRSHSSGYTRENSTGKSDHSDCHKSKEGCLAGSSPFAVRYPDTVCRLRVSTGRHADSDREMWWKAYDNITTYLSV